MVSPSAIARNLARVLAEQDNATYLELTVSQAREIVDGNDAGDFEMTLDTAQGDVFSGQHEEHFLIIHIKKD